MVTPQEEVLHNSNRAVLWATWLQLVWTVRLPAVLLTIAAGGAVPLLVLGWAGLITTAQGLLLLPALVVGAVVLAGAASALRTRAQGHLWLAIRPRCPDPHLWCRLGARAAAHVALRPGNDDTFVALGLCAWPQSHRASTRLGSVVAPWADRHGLTLECTCDSRMVPTYEPWGFCVTGTTVGWVPPLRRTTLVTMVREPRQSAP